MKEMTFREALRYALFLEMKRDSSVFLLGEDIGLYGGAFGVTEGLIREFGPERVIDTPISEGSLMGISTGASLMGMRPVLEIMFMDFATLIFDQMLNHTVKLKYMFGGSDLVKVPLVVRTPYGGGRAYGASHSQSLESFFMHVPGLKIACPSNPADAAGLLMQAVRDPNPVLFMEHKLLYGMKGAVDENPAPVEFGKAQVVRAGEHVTLMAYGRMLDMAEKAADYLKNEGIELELIDPRTLCPLDMDTLCRSVEKTGRLVTVEEGTLTGGIGAEVVASVAHRSFFSLNSPPLRVAAGDLPVPYSPALEEAVLPSVKDIVEGVLKVMDF